MCGWDRRFVHSGGISLDRGSGRAWSSEKTASRNKHDSQTSLLRQWRAGEVREKLFKVTLEFIAWHLRFGMASVLLSELTVFFCASLTLRKCDPAQLDWPWLWMSELRKYLFQILKSYTFQQIFNVKMCNFPFWWTFLLPALPCSTNCFQLLVISLT